jgi:hypothetical protein
LLSWEATGPLFSIFSFFAFNSPIRDIFHAIPTACAHNDIILQLAFGDTALLRLASLPLGIAGDSVFVSSSFFRTLNRSEMGIQSVRFKRVREIYFRERGAQSSRPKNGISSTRKTQSRLMGDMN